MWILAIVYYVQVGTYSPYGHAITFQEFDGKEQCELALKEVQGLSKDFFGKCIKK